MLTGVLLNAESTTVFLGVCHDCVRPVRETVAQVSGDACELACPVCGEAVPGERLMAVTTGQVCDGRCMGAVGPQCSCVCGGENHGQAFGREVTEEQTASAVAAYRRQVEAAERKRREAAEQRARAQRDRFTAWCAEHEQHQTVVDFLAEREEEHPFLDSLAAQVARHEPLSDRQVEAVTEWIAREQRRAAREADRAERLAQAGPAPTGHGITVTGAVVRTRLETNPYDSRNSTAKMLVETDEGWHVWTTIPAAVAETNATTEGNLYGLNQVRLRFVANLEASRNGDEAFVIGKRPRQAELR